MKTPLVSICIPTYNQTKYLRKVLDSVFEQTFTDYEVIVSDDSTTPDVKELLDEYIANGTVIRYFHHSPALGSPGNWNFAMQQAQGEYIKIMHHDDWFVTNTSLQEFVTLVRENNADFVFSASVSKYENYNFERYNYPTKKNLHVLYSDPTVLMNINYISTPSSTLFKKDSTIIFDSKFLWLVDVEFYIKYLLKYTKIASTDKALVGITAFANHNISNDCFSNTNIKLFEHLTLFDMYAHKSRHTLLLISYIYNLFFTTKTTRVSQLKKAGYIQTVKFPFRIALIITRFFLVIKKILFRK